MRFNIEAEQSKFLSMMIGQLPKNWGKVARAKYDGIAKQSVPEANHYLLALSDAIEGAIDIGAGDGELITLAAEIVMQVRQLAARSYELREGMARVYWLWPHLEALCEKYGVRFPHEHDRPQALARLNDSAWWLRGLRVSHNKHAEGCAIDAGLVNKKAGVYCSDDCLDRRGAQRRRNAETLQNVTMANTATGETMSLSDIAKAGTSNHENRRAELVTRVRGFEELAARYGHSAEFVTVTCPSRMHAVLTVGNQNPRYDGTKPDAAQKYLVDAWAKVRAQLARDGVKFYGLRIAEPHHDATPHWHLILFYNKSERLKKRIREVFKHYFIEDENFKDLTPDEKAHREKNGLKFVSIQQSRGSASGYVLKYVLKNIGGIDGESSDEADAQSVGLYPRVEAWAACWRIRQFQQIGGHYVTVWRELRRVDECQLEGKRPAFVKLWQACQKVAEKKADFAEFIEAMGGLSRPPRESAFQVDYDLYMGQGRYGETVLKRVLGVGERFGREVVATNRDEWVRV